MLSRVHCFQHRPAALRWGQLISPQSQCLPLLASREGRASSGWVGKWIRAGALRQRCNLLYKSWVLIIEPGLLAAAAGKTGPWLPLNLMAFGHLIPLAYLKIRMPVPSEMHVVRWNPLSRCRQKTFTQLASAEPGALPQALGCLGHDLWVEEEWAGAQGMGLGSAHKQRHWARCLCLCRAAAHPSPFAPPLSRSSPARLRPPLAVRWQRAGATAQPRAGGQIRNHASEATGKRGEDQFWGIWGQRRLWLQPRELFLVGSY